MPPQFFKDASSGGLSSKFKPRTFAFSFGKTDNFSTTSPNTSSHELSDNSDDLPKSSSTAATSMNLTRFFMASGSKGNIHQKVNTQEDIILNDSSIDNVEQLVRNLRADHQVQSQSTPTKRLAAPIRAMNDPQETSHRKTRSGKVRHSRDVQAQKRPHNGHKSANQPDEEAVEILEMSDSSNVSSLSVEENLNVINNRNASMPNNHDQEIEPDIQPLYSSRSDETSDNYLLEALSKSQRMCNALKQKLESANSQIAFQHDTITKQTGSINDLKVMFGRFQENFVQLQADTQKFKKLKNHDNEIIKQTKAEYDGLLKSFNVYKSEVDDVKKKLDHLKQLKQSTGYELAKKNKEISTLQQRLDETSGFLSEQKIKTTELEKNLDKSRKDYDKQIQDHLQNFKNLDSKLESTLGCGFEKVNTNIS